jgi:ribosome-associated protein
MNPSSSVNTPPASTSSSTPAAYDALAVAVEIARLLSDDRCSDVTLLDVRGISSVQDFVVLASGTSDRQMRSAAADIKNLLPKLGSSVYRTSIDDQSTWIVVDCVDTVIHVFEPNTRSYYDLESMWGDAPKVEWLRPGQKPFSADSYDTDQGDSDEPLPARQAVEASEPDADMELTTGSAEAFVQEARASVAPPARGKALKSKPVPKAKAVKKAAPPARKSAAKKASAPVKKAAAKAVKNPAAKVVKKASKKPAKKLAPPAKKPVAKKPTAKKKTAKKKSR